MLYANLMIEFVCFPSMPPIQPVGWWHYLQWRTTSIPPHLSHFFYLSWEDALWDLQKYFGFKKGSVALVPQFFCGDVVKNMETHGFKCVWYPVDRNFQTPVATFKHHLYKHQPKIAVIFHSVGITNRLFNNSKNWLSALPNDCLLIEDSVHRVVNPQKITLLTDRHVVLDSLRKVVPLAGSNLFGSSTLQKLKPTPAWKTLPYQLHVIGWWMTFQFCLLMGLAIKTAEWQSWWNKAAEWTMIKGYDVIGDSYKAGTGWWLLRKLSSYLAHDRIAAIKRAQVELYQKQLSPLWYSSKVFPIEFEQKDAPSMRAFPIGLKLPIAKQVLQNLRQKNLLVRFELDDSKWSKKQKVIYLPLGPHLSKNDIFFSAQVMLEAVSETDAGLS